MNRYIIILGTLFFLITLVVAYIFISGPDEQTPTPQPGIVVPNNSSTVTIPQTPTDTQAAAQSAVRSTFQAEVADGHPDNIKLDATIIAGDWALQLWTGDVMGGEALMKFDSTQAKWTMVDIGGGSWSLGGLMSAGVSQEVAQTLVSSRGY